MSIEDVLKFQERYENGYNLEEDKEYNKWKSLKESRCVFSMLFHQIEIYKLVYFTPFPPYMSCLIKQL